MEHEVGAAELGTQPLRQPAGHLQRRPPGSEAEMHLLVVATHLAHEIEHDVAARPRHLLVRRLAARGDHADPRRVEPVSGGEALGQLLLRRGAEQEVVPGRAFDHERVHALAREPERVGDVLGLVPLQEGVAHTEHELVGGFGPPPHLGHGPSPARGPVAWRCVVAEDIMR
jgi:hypothetical protein